MSPDRHRASCVPPTTRVALGSFAVFVVLLVGGALPAFSSAAVPGQPVVPLRVQDPAALGKEKAAAEQRYALWRQRHGLAPTTLAPAPRTVVSGNLNQPGITDPATGVTPSDSTGSIGPSNYVEFINSEIAIYSNTDLSAPTSSLDEGTFVGDPTAFTCDPQVQWDQQGQRWLYAALNCGAPAGSQSFYFGFSKTASPGPLGSNWCQYTVSTAHSIEDYPKLGHDDSQIIVGTNAFDDRGKEPYTGSHIWIFDKPGPGDVATCPTSGTELGDSKEANAAGFTPVAVDMADSSTTGYVVDIASDQAHLDLYAIGHDGSGNNVLSTTSVAVPAFAVPAPVPQPGGTGGVIDSSDARLTQAVAVTDPATGHEGIWTQHTVAGSGGGPSVVRWYELTPAASTPRQTGTVGGPSSSFAFNGAISPAKDGTSAAIFYNSGSSSRLVDMRVQDRRSDTTLGTTIEDLQLAASSDIDGDLSCPSQDPMAPSCRWGDYAGASPDPSNGCLVWGTSMLTVDSPDGLGTPQWGTQNAAIDVCGFTLSVAKSGAGSGTVSSNIAGISCGAACAHSYGVGTSVTLTATPATGSSLSGWSGACSGTGTCTVSMTQARSVTATFALLPEALSVSKSGSGSGTVNSSPAGISCGSTCSQAFDYGTSVTLTAIPTTGSGFAGWSGACSGAGTCTVTMSQAVSIGATFALKPVCLVPKLTGKKLDAAKRALAKAGCKPGKITRKFSKVKKGRVISQRPKRGTKLAAGARVNLVISKGKKP